MFRLTPDSAKGRMLVNGYLDGDSGSASPVYLRRLLETPGTNQSLYRYLVGHYDDDGEFHKGKGADKMPEVVGKHLGKHWYTGPAKLMAMTPVGRDYAMEKILERTLPQVNGSTELARQFLAAGGQV